MSPRNKFFILFITCAVLLAHNAFAQPQNLSVNDPTAKSLLAEAPILPDVKLFHRTHPEKIVFTQIKLAKGQPDLDSFSKNSPRVKTAQEIDKTAMTLAEYNRIGNSFNMHDEKAPIIVHTSLYADEYSSLQDMILFDEFDQATYFQFRLYGHTVGIVPENIEKFSRLALSKTSAERFFGITGGDKDVMAEFVLIPSFSDNKKPLVLQDHEIWLMSARIAEFRIWSKSKDNPQLLWYYRAPWYKPVDKTNIGDLYTKP